MTWHNPPVLAERIAEFIRGDSRESLDELAAALHAAWQTDDGYRRLCRRHGTEAAAMDGWRRLPVVPASEAPAAPDQAAAGGAEVVRAAIDGALPRAVPELGARPPVLSLVAEDGGDSPPVQLLSATVLGCRGADDSRVAASRRGVEVAQARSFLGARQRDRRSPVILGSAAALVQLVTGLERRGLRFRLPPGSLALACHEGDAAGGDTPDWPGLTAALAASLALPADRLVRAFRAAGTTSWLFARSAPDGSLQPYLPWPWTGVAVLSPDGRAAVAPGAAGALTVLDLAAGGPPLLRLGRQTASAVGDGFTLHPRAVAGGG